MKPLHFDIDTTWDGALLEPAAVAHARVSVAPDGVWFEVDAPWGGDPPPSSPPGPTERLWMFEVVEVFLCGPNAVYLEVELGPHGHHLALRLEGVRRVVRSSIPLHYEVRRQAGRWQGRACIALHEVPWPVVQANAFAIRGQGQARRYMAAIPTRGEQPDFHRLEAFAPVHGWTVEAVAKVTGTA
ncbi:MAG: hypothetical protein AAFX99_01705 [Myxococcota bacterium]